MTIALFTTLFLIGFVGSFISGMLGIGGSIIKYPMVARHSPLVGVASYTAHQVSGISAVQVFFATISAVVTFRKGNYLNYKLISLYGRIHYCWEFYRRLRSQRLVRGTPLTLFMRFWPRLLR